MTTLGYLRSLARKKLGWGANVYDCYDDPTDRWECSAINRHNLGYRTQEKDRDRARIMMAILLDNLENYDG